MNAELKCICPTDGICEACLQEYNTTQERECNKCNLEPVLMCGCDYPENWHNQIAKRKWKEYQAWVTEFKKKAWLSVPSFGRWLDKQENTAQATEPMIVVCGSCGVKSFQATKNQITKSKIVEYYEFGGSGYDDLRYFENWLNKEDK